MPRRRKGVNQRFGRRALKKRICASAKDGCSAIYASLSYCAIRTSLAELGKMLDLMEEIHRKFMIQTDELCV
jgi:ribosomal protein S6